MNARPRKGGEREDGSGVIHGNREMCKCLGEVATFFCIYLTDSKTPLEVYELLSVCVPNLP